MTTVDCQPSWAARLSSPVRTQANPAYRPSESAGAALPNHLKTMGEVDPNELLSNPLEVRHIHVSGNQKTSTPFIINEVNLSSAKTLGDILSSCHYAHQDLSNLDIFDRVNIILEKGSDPGSCDIDIEVVEKQSLKVSGGTEFDSIEATLRMEALYRNAFGQAEQVKVSGTYGMGKSGGFDVSLFKPRLYGTRASCTGSAFLNQTNFTKFSSYILDTQGISIDFLDPTGQFSLGYSCAKRDILLGEGSSGSIAREARTSMKSAITATIKSDSRDNPMLPTRGALLSLGSEVGIPVAGDVTFVKCTAHNQAYIPIGKSISFGISLKYGFILPYQTGTRLREKSTTPLPERFMYGGPLSLRGFGHNSVGPRDGKDMLGGDALTAAAANVTFALPHPFLQKIGIRGHIFANAASIVSLTDGAPRRQQVRKLWTDARSSVGVGIVIPTTFGRVELNYARPVTSRSMDRTQLFQMGISSSFL